MMKTACKLIGNKFKRLSWPALVVLLIVAYLLSPPLSAQSKLPELQAKIPLGHTGKIIAAAFSNDGKLAFSLAKDQSLRVWDVATAREIKHFIANADHVPSFAISSDGQWIALGGDKDDINIIETKSGKILKRLQGHQRKITSLRFSPDNQFLLSASNDKTIKVWELASSKVIKQLRQHKKAIQTMRFSHQGKYLASAGKDRQIIIWKWPSLEPIKTLKKHKKPILALSFSKDDKILASAGEDKHIILWDWQKAKVKKRFKAHKKAITSLDFSPKSNRLLSSSKDRELIQWDWDKQTNDIKLQLKFSSHEDSILIANYSPSGDFVLSASQSKLRLWGAHYANLVHQFKAYASPANTLVYSADGRYLISAHQDKSLKVWDLHSGENLSILSGHRAQIQDLLIAPDPQSNKPTLISVANDRLMIFWDLEKGQFSKRLRGHKAAINQVLANKELTKLYTISDDGSIQAWPFAGDKNKGKDNKGKKLFPRQEQAILQFALDNDEELIISNDSQHQLKIWDIKSQKASLLAKEKYPISALLLTANNELISAGWELKLWSLVKQKLIKTLTNPHQAGISQLAKSRDNRYFASAAWDGSIALWDLASQTMIQQFFAHPGGVKSLEFSPHGQQLASSGQDGSIKLWDIKTIIIDTTQDDTHQQETVKHKNQQTKTQPQSNQVSEIIRLIGANNGEWLALTPDGYYQHSPEGSNLIHWVAKDGLENYGFEQFQQHFYRPDIIQKRLQGKLQAGYPAPVKNMPPQIYLASHLQQIKTQQEQVKIKLAWDKTRSISQLKTYVNGQLKQHHHIDKEEPELLEFSLPLFHGYNQITSIGLNHLGQISNQQVMSVYANKPLAKKPQLNILAIGVSEYQHLGIEMQLNYAHSDALHFIQGFESAAQDLFSQINSVYIANEKASKSNILNELKKLGQAKQDDLNLIFFAGHGYKDDDKTFYLLSHQSKLGQLSDSAIAWNDIKQHILAWDNRSILFLDACHSGSIVTPHVLSNNALAADLRNQEKAPAIMVFSAAKGRQYAMESRRFGQGSGLFSHALSKAIGKENYRIDYNQNGLIEFSEMQQFVSHYVNEKSQGQQSPWLSYASLYGDLAIAKVNHQTTSTYAPNLSLFQLALFGEKLQ